MIVSVVTKSKSDVSVMQEPSVEGRFLDIG